MADRWPILRERVERAREWERTGASLASADFELRDLLYTADALLKLAHKVDQALDYVRCARTYAHRHVEFFNKVAIAWAAWRDREPA